MGLQRRVVILRPLGLGDFLTGVPAYRAIARAFPDHRKILAAPRALAPLIDLVGAIDELAATQPLAPLDPALHAAAVAVDLHGRGPASHRVLLAAEPQRLIGFANSEVPQSTGGATWLADEHEVTRWCRMLSLAGVQADARELDLAVPAIFVPARLRGATLIHASAASAARRWPAVRWAAVARAESAAGRTVVLTGDARDVPLAHAIADNAGISAADVYAGRTDLLELAALVAAAGRVVCGDTGVAHLATAYRTPSVVLFGPIPPAGWGPPPDRPYHRALWAGQVGDPHAEQVNPGLLAITVDMVISALAQLDGIDTAALERRKIVTAAPSYVVRANSR